jgi:hypothetical protein
MTVLHEIMHLGLGPKYSPHKFSVSKNALRETQDMLLQTACKH